MGRKCIDLVGNVYGDLTVIHRSSPYKEHPVKWMTLCSCGNMREFPGRRLVKGDATHCGCKSRDNRSQSQIENISGVRFGSLVAVEFQRSHKGHAIWLFQCDCGTKLEREATAVKRGIVVACFNCRYDHRSEVQAINLQGQTFGQLEVIKKGHKNSKGEWYWLCRCSCGKEYEVRGTHLRAGGVKRCRKCQGLRQRVVTPKSGYPTEFSLDLRKRIRRRDGRSCQLCGKICRKGGLDVHHIIPDRNNNDKSNLVSLCEQCHYKMHTKERAKWIPYWQQHLTDKYGYSY